MFLRLQPVEMSPPPEAISLIKRKWDAQILKFDAAAIRANTVTASKNYELAGHLIDALEKTYLKYEETWNDFVNASLEIGYECKEFHTIHNRVTEAKWDLITKLTSLRKKLRDEENKPKPKKDVPPLKIPEFHGDHHEWSGFWESYKDVIHENSTIPATLKFHHLKGALKGEAASLIAGFTLTEANYNTVIDLLKRKYDDPNKTKRVLINKLFDIKIIKHAKADLIKFTGENQEVAR